MKSEIADFKSTMLNNYLTSLYFYLIPRNEINEETTVSMGYISNKITNICFNPFIEKYNVECLLVNVDLSDYDYQENIHYPYIYRIKNLEFRDINLETIDLSSTYNSIDRNYESKLLMYPYRYYLLTDYINPPLLIKPQYLTNNRIEIYVKVGVSNTSKYNIYVKNYKGDVNGNLEGVVNNNPLLFPVVADSYQEFIGSQGNSFNLNKQLALLENNTNYKQGTRTNTVNAFTSMLGSIGGLATLDAGGTIASIFGGINTGVNQYNLKESTKLKEYQIEKSYLATKQDLINTPNTLKSIGNDSIFNLENGKNRIDLIEYGIKTDKEQKILNFFNRYGVQTMNYDIPNFKTRKYYNYIKTVNCNIDNSKIPYNDLKKIEEIFNSGVTFWHIDNGAMVKNYYVENEVL